MGVDLEKWLEMFFVLGYVSVVGFDGLLVDFEAFVESNVAVAHLLKPRLPHLINKLTQLILIRQLAIRLFQRRLLESPVEVGFLQMGGFGGVGSRAGVGERGLGELAFDGAVEVVVGGGFHNWGREDELVLTRKMMTLDQVLRSTRPLNLNSSRRKDSPRRHSIPIIRIAPRSLG